MAWSWSGWARAGADFDQITAVRPDQIDLSIQFLSNLFGSMGGLLPLTGANQLTGLIFHTFNTGIFSIGMLFVTYTVTVGVISSAESGEALGQKLRTNSTLLRQIIGTSFLAPQFNGYCGLQVLVMWFVLNGVYLANHMWGAVLNASKIYGNVLVSVYNPSERGTKALETSPLNMSVKGIEGGVGLASSLFRSQVCYHALLKKECSENY